MMKKTLWITIALVSILVLFSACQGTMSVADNPFEESGPNVVINEKGIDNYPIFEKEILVGYENIEALNAFADNLGAVVNDTIPQIRVASLRTELSVKQTLDMLKGKKLEGIRFVEPSYVRTQEEPTIGGDLLEQAVSRAAPDDPFYGFQWGHRVVNSEAAWDAGYDGSGVVVAICDGGADSAHPDLAGQFVDGFNALTDTVIPAGTSVPYGAHGTHVSGIVAATRNNGIGVAGLASGAKLMPIPVFAPDYIGDFNVGQGWVWAVDNGAKILQNSWGGPGYSQTQKDAADYALFFGAMVIVSTGNTHVDENWGQPNSLPGILGVGSINALGEVADHTSRGDSLSVLAPGDVVLSTVPQADAEIQGNQPYAYWGGTSMASPWVSALAAILFQKFPDATPYQIRKIIEQTAVAPNGFGRGIADYTPETGYGYIDVEAALAAELPVDVGGNLFVSVTDSTGLWPLAGVSVTLSRDGLPSYYAQTDWWGDAWFLEIDPDTYDVIIGGPDYSRADSEAFRIQEELGVTVNDVIVGAGGLIEVAFTSEFAGSLTMPDADKEYTVSVVDAWTEGIVYQQSVVGPGEEVLITRPNNGDGEVLYYITVEPSPALDPAPDPIVSDDFSSGDFSNPNFAWDLSGDVDPFVQTLVVPDGSTHAVEFGDVDDSQSSWFSTTQDVPVGTPYLLRFDRKVSSEDGWDFFEVYVNGVMVYNASGEEDWETITLALEAGENVIEFGYVKDSSVSEGDDTAWVANVGISPRQADYLDMFVVGDMTLNGNAPIPIAHNLYDSFYIDEFAIGDIPWASF
ncbi:MAG TPA: S8 family serine peptidase [Thermotogota bacterium]|nr:S8 family serine peptidase [Thermotogota bacterium]